MGNFVEARLINFYMGKLPNALNDRQKKNHIDYLLKVLRKAGKIHVGSNKNWEIGPEEINDK